MSENSEQKTEQVDKKKINLKEFVDITNNIANKKDLLTSQKYNKKDIDNLKLYVQNVNTEINTVLPNADKYNNMNISKIQTKYDNEEDNYENLAEQRKKIEEKMAKIKEISENLRGNELVEFLEKNVIVKQMREYNKYANGIVAANDKEETIKNVIDEFKVNKSDKIVNTYKIHKEIINLLYDFSDGYLKINNIHNKDVNNINYEYGLKLNELTGEELAEKLKTLVNNNNNYNNDDDALIISKLNNIHKSGANDNTDDDATIIAELNVLCGTYIPESGGKENVDKQVNELVDKCSKSIDIVSERYISTDKTTFSHAHNVHLKEMIDFAKNKVKTCKNMSGICRENLHLVYALGLLKKCEASDNYVHIPNNIKYKNVDSFDNNKEMLKLFDKIVKLEENISKLKTYCFDKSKCRINNMDYYRNIVQNVLKMGDDDASYTLIIVVILVSCYALEKSGYFKDVKSEVFKLRTELSNLLLENTRAFTFNNGFVDKIMLLHQYCLDSLRECNVY